MYNFELIVKTAVERFTEELRSQITLHVLITNDTENNAKHVCEELSMAFHEKGLLKSDRFVAEEFSNIPSQFIGQSAAKVNRLAEEAAGGILLIYENNNSFMEESRASNYQYQIKEVFDTLAYILTKDKFNLMLVFAPFEDLLKECNEKYNDFLALLKNIISL